MPSQIFINYIASENHAVSRLEVISSMKELCLCHDFTRTVSKMTGFVLHPRSLNTCILGTRNERLGN